MTQEQLRQDPSLMDEEHELEFYENLYDDIIHDKEVIVDKKDYEEDIENYWALKKLRMDHFHLFYVFYGLLTFSLGFYDYNNMFQTLSVHNFLMMFGGVLLMIISVRIFAAELKHKGDYLRYRKKRLLKAC